MWLAILGFLSKVLDFVNPWSSYWAGKAKSRYEKKTDAGKKLDESAKKGDDFDAFLNSLNDSNNP